MSPTRRYGARSVELSNRDKVLFPDDGLTKGDLVDYYEKVADLLLTHVRDRPLTLKRHPDGIGSDGFYQKEASDHFPEWIRRIRVPLKGGGEQVQVGVDDTASLVYLAQQGTVTFHAWTSRAPELEKPDRMIFDLDPGEEGAFDVVREAARELRELLEGVGLAPFLLVTGSSGLHVRVPLRRDPGFDRVRAFARRVAELLARRRPHRYTVEVRKKKRKGRLFLDVARNGHGQTAVVPYSLRTLPAAPAAVPLEWDELGALEGPRRWTLASVGRRMGQREDPWKGMGRRAASLEAAEERWASRHGAEEGEGSAGAED